MEEFKLHWAPENYKKTIDSYNEKISKLKNERARIMAEYVGQNANVPTQRDRTVWIEVEMEYIDKDGNTVVEALRDMVLGYYAIQKGTNSFFEEMVVTPVLYRTIGKNYSVTDKSRRFMLQNFVCEGTVEIRYREKWSDTYYYSRGGNFKEMKMYDTNSKWHGGENENIKYIEMCMCECGCVRESRDTQGNWNMD